MLGDVMGEAGLKTLEEKLPALMAEQEPGFVIVNGENSAGGFGVNENALGRILAAGADIISTGNHIWEKRDFWPFLESEERILRPANYPQGPGRGWIKVNKKTTDALKTFLVINLQGRELMNSIDCPFRCFDEIIAAAANDKPIVLVDFHAESSREKEAFGFYADGRAAVVAGTHTHVQTADEKILPKGSAYISDLGMTGVNDAVIGMEPKICIDRARNQVLYHMEAAASGGCTRIQGLIADISDDSGKAVSIQRISV